MLESINWLRLLADVLVAVGSFFLGHKRATAKKNGPIK